MAPPGPMGACQGRRRGIGGRWGDHYRKAGRTFFPLRIQAIGYNKSLRIKDGLDLDSYLATAVNSHQSTGEVHHVKPRFAAEAPALGEEYVSNATQKMSRDEQGRVIVEFDTGALYTVERDVLGWAGKAEVLQPAVLKDSLDCKILSLWRLRSSPTSRKGPNHD